MAVIPTGPFGQHISSVARGTSPDIAVEKKGGAFGAYVSDLAHQRNEARRAAAAESEATITIGETSNALTLALNASVAALNDALAETGLEIAPVSSPDTGTEEVSSESTAMVIVASVTSAFGAFVEASQASGETGTEAELLESYTSMIRGAIEAGFTEATGVLDGASQLSEENNALLTETLAAVNIKIDLFFETMLAAINASGEETEVIENPEQEVVKLVTDTTE
jgi:hypothetical protein